MRDFFKGSSLKALIITAVVLLGLIVYPAAAGGSFLAGVLGFVSSPMQSIATEVTENVTEFIDLDGYTKDELKLLVESLQTEAAQLRGQLVDYEAVKLENDRLREQLKISEEAPDTEMCSASVIGRDPNDVFYGFSIDKGSLAGVSAGDPVITSQGLVGMVEEVYATTSKVTCLLSENMKVAAMSVDKQESGVITSDIITSSSGLLRLEYLSNDTAVEPGDIITTSGVGGSYPADLVIGEVQKVEKSENDISKYAVVKPYENLADVSEVQVILSFPGKGDDSNDIIDKEPSGGEDAE